MSIQYKTRTWQMVYGKAMQDAAHHASLPARSRGRQPAERLFCRDDGPHAARPDMAAGEREHFAEHFARDFAVALSEARRCAELS